MNSINYIIKEKLLSFAILSFWSFIYSIPSYFIWNWICYGKFNLPFLNMFELTGLIVLCNILFKTNIITVKYTLPPIDYKIKEDDE